MMPKVQVNVVRAIMMKRLLKLLLKEERIIITYDLDFGELYRNFGASSIILRLRSKNPLVVLEYLVEFLRTMEKQKIDMKNKLAIIREGRVRMIG